MEKNNCTEERVNTFMEISIEAALEWGYSRSDIVYRYVGNQLKSGLLVECNRAFDVAYRRMNEAEAKREKRERRCKIADGKGGFIMCPERNRCSECNRARAIILSLDKLRSGDNEDDSTFDIAGYGDIADDAVAFARHDILLTRLSEIDPRYARVLHARYDGEKTTEISNDLMLPWSTTKDLESKVMELAQSIVGDIR